MAQTNRKRKFIQIQLKISRFGTNSLAVTLARLAKMMRFKLKRSTSTRRLNQITAKKLELILFSSLKVKYRSCKRARCPRVVFSKTVPLHIKPGDHGVLNLWHEPSKYDLCARVMLAYENIELSDKGKYLDGVKFAKLRAGNLKRIHLPRWKERYERTMMMARLRKMENMNVPLDSYLPFTDEQIRIANGLPIFRPMGSNPESTSRKRSSRRVPLDQIQHPVVDPKRLKQTSIERFLKPFKREQRHQGQQHDKKKVPSRVVLSAKKTK